MFWDKIFSSQAKKNSNIFFFLLSLTDFSDARRDDSRTDQLQVVQDEILEEGAPAMMDEQSNLNQS